MPIDKSLLNDFEDVVLDLHPHWFYFLEPIIAGVVWLVIAILFGIWFGMNGWLWSLMGIIIVGVGIWALYRFVVWRSIHFVVTTDRIIYRSGVLRKRGVQMPLERVNNVNFHQRFYERLFGAGDVVIESAGRDGVQRFSDIQHPDSVQNTIYRTIEENENKGWEKVAKTAGAAAATGVVPGAPASAADELTKLAALRDAGNITQAEYDAQKARLLGTLPPPPATPPS